MKKTVFLAILMFFLIISTTYSKTKKIPEVPYEEGVYLVEQINNIVNKKDKKRKYITIYHFSKGYRLFNLKDYEKAKNEFHGSLNLVKTANSFYYLGKTYYFLKEYDKSLAVLSRAMRIVMKDETVLYYKEILKVVGRIYFLQGRIKEAKEMFIRSNRKYVRGEEWRF